LEATLEDRSVREERQNFDPVGHYPRPDITQLIVNRRRQSTLRLDDSAPDASLASLESSLYWAPRPQVRMALTGPLALPILPPYLDEVNRPTAGGANVPGPGPGPRTTIRRPH